MKRFGLYTRLVQRQENGDGAGSGMPPPAQFDIESAVTELKKRGATVFLNEEAYKNTLNATKGNIDSDYRKYAKEITGVDWNKDEPFADYLKRGVDEFTNKQITAKSGNQTAEFDAVKTTLTKKEEELKNLSQKLQQYETAEKQRQQTDLIKSALDGKSLKKTGIPAYDKVAGQQLFAAIQSEFQFIEENGQVFIKSKNGETSKDVQAVIGQFLANNPDWKDAFETPLKDTMPPDGSPGTAGGVLTDQRRKEIEDEIYAANGEPTDYRNPNTIRILKKYNLWNGGNPTLFK